MFAFVVLLLGKLLCDWKFGILVARAFLGGFDCVLGGFKISVAPFVPFVGHRFFFGVEFKVVGFGLLCLTVVLLSCRFHFSLRLKNVCKHGSYLIWPVQRCS